MEALATRGHATAATTLSFALVLLAMTPLGAGEWVAWTLVGVSSIAASLSLVGIAARAPNARILVPVFVPGTFLLIAAVSDHLQGPEDERLSLAFVLVAGVPALVVGLTAYVVRHRGGRLRPPGPSFHRRVEALHYYFVMLAIGLGAAVWTHSDRGLADALRTVIGGGA